MACLVDTGILLRLVNRTDPQHAVIRSALRALRARGERLATTSQNLGEFWNVCTRPATSRGGYGLSAESAEHKLRLIERVFARLPDSPSSYQVWRKLLVRHRIMGVQVHDAKLAALMKVHGIALILTLNAADFQRFDGMTVLTPESLNAQSRA